MVTPASIASWISAVAAASSDGAVHAGKRHAAKPNGRAVDSAFADCALGQGLGHGVLLIRYGSRFRGDDRPAGVRAASTRSRPRRHVLSWRHRTARFGTRDAGERHDNTGFSPSPCRRLSAHRRKRTAHRRSLSDPPGHHHRALPGRRADRPGGAADRAQARGQARSEFHRRKRQRRRHQHRRPARRARGARRLHAVRSTICRSRPTCRSTRRCRSTPRRTSLPITMINSNPLVLVGRKTLRGQHAAGAGGLDEVATGAGQDGASRHRLDRPSRHRPAGAGARRRRSTTSRIAAPRRCCRTRSAATSTCSSPRRSRWSAQFAAGAGQGVRHHLEGHLAAVPRRAELRAGLRAEARHLVLAHHAGAGRARRSRSSTRSTARCRTRSTIRRSSRSGR